MTLVNYNKYSAVKTIDTGEDILLGGFKFDSDFDVIHMVLFILVQGGPVTTEQMKIEVHGEENCVSKLFESNTINIMDINSTSSVWRGYVRFDFNYQNINKDIYYYLRLVTTNYTRGLNVLATFFDWEDVINLHDGLDTVIAFTDRSQKVAFYGHFV